MNSGVMYSFAKTAPTTGQAPAMKTAGRRKRLRLGFLFMGGRPLDELGQRLKMTQDDRPVDRLGIGAQIDHELLPRLLRLVEPLVSVAQAAMGAGDVGIDRQRPLVILPGRLEMLVQSLLPLRGRETLLVALVARLLLARLPIRLFLLVGGAVLGAGRGPRPEGSQGVPPGHVTLRVGFILRHQAGGQGQSR